jgi:hypothetical protein
MIDSQKLREYIDARIKELAQERAKFSSETKEGYERRFDTTVRIMELTRLWDIINKG